MGKFTYWKFILDHLGALPDVSSFEKDLTGKTVVLTGATSGGVGFEIAKHLIRVNPKKIILGCRNLKKGDEVLETLKSLGYNRAEAWLLDLANFETITSFVDKFEKEGENKLDFLIQCAGTWFGTYERTVDGWETNMQTNFLGPVLLVLLLLPFLKKAQASITTSTASDSDSDDSESEEEVITPRIVIVGSESHHFIESMPEAEEVNILSKFNDDEYCISEGKTIGRRYFVAKVFLVFFTRQLSTYLSATDKVTTDSTSSTPITITCTTPGFTDTKIFTSSSGGVHPMQSGISFSIARLFLARSPEVGSRPVMWSVYERGDVVHGKYCANCQVEEESDFAISKIGWDIQRRIWREALDVLMTVDGRIRLIEEEYLKEAH